ncbi:hypothetical protein [Vibrio caribbeanicus]|uniref:hypothetical protein n=1 Tax=Vibrio caribbeanicus TaxID=701175 RepID=UPI0030D9FD2A
MKIPMKSILGQITLLGAAISFSSQAYALDSFKTDDYSRQCPELNQDFDFNFKYITPDSCYYFAEEVRCGFGSEKACSDVDLSDCDNGFIPIRLGLDVYCSKKKPHNPLYAPLDALYGESGVFSDLADYYSVGSQARGPLQEVQIKFTSQDNEAVERALTVLWERWKHYDQNENDLETRNKIGYRYLDTAMYRLKAKLLEHKRILAKAKDLEAINRGDPNPVNTREIVRLFDASFESLKAEVKYYMEHIFIDEKYELHELIENRRKDFYEINAGGDDTVILFNNAIQRASESLYDQAMILVSFNVPREERMRREEKYAEWQTYVKGAYKSYRALKLGRNINPSVDKALEDSLELTRQATAAMLDRAQYMVEKGTLYVPHYKKSDPECEQQNIWKNLCTTGEVVIAVVNEKFDTNVIRFNDEFKTVDSNSRKTIVHEGKTYVQDEDSKTLSKSGHLASFNYVRTYPACAGKAELKFVDNEYNCYELIDGSKIKRKY